jgi:hypothetical protein
MPRLHTDDQGSALTEAAIVFPCLVLAVFWSAALTDVLILKCKAAEALRYALWENTVFKPPVRIDAEVRSRFADLRSPSRVRTQNTGLLLYPFARNLAWRAEVDSTSAEVSLGGSSPLQKTGAPWDRFLDAVAGTLSRSVDGATAAMRFNTRGMAIARVALEHAHHDARSPILQGGALPGLRGGGDLGHGRAPGDFHLQAPLPSQRPMQLVFDTWKAWPKPAAYTLTGAGTDLSISPSRTYPEVEKQVSAQVGRIAYFGMNGMAGFRDLRDFVGRLMRSGVSRRLAGGTLPDIFSAGRMDESATDRGPITILPPERAAESWVPHECEIAGAMVPCPTQRAGDLTTSGAAPRHLDGEHSIGDRVDRTRYTVPYRIQSTYWKRCGGMDRELDSVELATVDPRLATQNGYVRTYRCRGHFFAGSAKAQVANSYRGCR